VKRVRVATSDWMEQQIILGRGGTRISARELEMEVFSQKKLIRSKRVTENQKNNFMLGQLDEETIMKLNNWNNKD
jgi:predicted RNA-binding protein with PIN domain